MRKDLKFSEHQLNTEALGSLSSGTGEFLINRIIIKDSGKKEVPLSTSRKTCVGVAGCDSESASHLPRVTAVWCKP